jgi:hypothetical protein
MMLHALVVLLSITALSVIASPAEPRLESRAAPDNIVSIDSTTKYCMIMPRYAPYIVTLFWY